MPSTLRQVLVSPDHSPWTTTWETCRKTGWDVLLRLPPSPTPSLIYWDWSLQVPSSASVSPT